MKKIVFTLIFTIFTCLQLSADSLDSAKTLLNAKNYSESLKNLQTLTAQEPENIEALYYLALNHYLIGNYEKMITIGVKAYTKDHTLAKEVRQYSNDQNFGADVKIGLFRKIRLAKQIRNELYLVLEDQPNNANAHYALGYYYILTPYLLSGSVKKSLYHIDQLSKQDKKRAYPIYSSYYLKTKNSKKHIENLNQWYTDYPDDWSAVIELARVEQNKGMHEKSFTLLNQWIQKNPQDAKAVYQIGRLAATTGDFLEEGKSSLLKYLDFPKDIDNPEPKWAHYRLAMIYQHLKDISKAQEHISKALSFDSKNKEFLKLKAKL